MGIYLGMYFDEAPKTSRKDIFDYAEEFQKLSVSLSEGRRLIQIKGRRRSGKTSLLLSCLNELDRPFIVLDGRAFSSSPQVRREEFVKLLENTLNGFLKKEKKLQRKIVDALKQVQGLEASTDARVSLRWGPGPEDAAWLSQWTAPATPIWLADSPAARKSDPLISPTTAVATSFSLGLESSHPAFPLLPPASSSSLAPR